MIIDVVRHHIICVIMTVTLIVIVRMVVESESHYDSLSHQVLYLHPRYAMK